jgi:hypothetical protein
MALIHVTGDFLRENPDVSIELGARKTPAGHWLAVRIALPGDPARMAVYDFVADTR